MSLELEVSNRGVHLLKGDSINRVSLELEVSNRGVHLLKGD